MPLRSSPSDLYRVSWAPLVGVVAFALVAAIAALDPGPFPMLLISAGPAMTLLALGLEAFNALRTLVEYLLNGVYAGEADKVEQLLLRYQSRQRQRAILQRVVRMEGEPTGQDLDEIVEQVLRHRHLVPQARNLLISYAIVATRLLGSFTVASAALVFWSIAAGVDLPFRGIAVDDAIGVSSLFSVLEQLVYFNLAALSTVGFGDITAVTIESRILADIEVVTLSVFLFLGGNLFVGLLLENSALAWGGRRDSIRRHLRLTIEQKRRVMRTSPEASAPERVEFPTVEVPQPNSNGEALLRPFRMDSPTGEGALNFPGVSWRDGSFLMLQGGNGSGKSTILQHVSRMPDLIRLSEGATRCVLLDQMYEHMLFPYKPIWWNIVVPKLVNERVSQEECRRQAYDQLDEFGLSLDIERFPGALSGGEKHLVLLARFALTSHNVLLLDEPTTGVDVERLDSLWRMVDYFVSEQNKRLVIVSHDEPLEASILDEIQFAGVAGSGLTLKTMKFGG